MQDEQSQAKESSDPELGPEPIRLEAQVDEAVSLESEEPPYDEQDDQAVAARGERKSGHRGGEVDEKCLVVDTQVDPLGPNETYHDNGDHVLSDSDLIDPGRWSFDFIRSLSAKRRERFFRSQNQQLLKTHIYAKRVIILPAVPHHERWPSRSTVVIFVRRDSCNDLLVVAAGDQEAVNRVSLSLTSKMCRGATF